MAAPQARRPITDARQLLVEGSHDAAFFEALLQHEGIALQVQAAGGERKLAGNLAALAVDRAWHRFADPGRVLVVGVVRDANGDARGAFQSVCSALSAARLPVPDETGALKPGSLAVGTGGAPAEVRSGVFLMPGGGRQGALEDLCMESVAEQPVVECVDAFVRCVRERAQREIAPHRLGKVRARAYIAGHMDSPDLHVGTAAERGYWPFDHEAFAELKTFIRDLGEA